MAKNVFRNTRGPTRPLKEAAATLATAVWCGEVIVAVLLASRRFSGAFAPPESATLSILAGGFCVAVSLFCCGIASAASMNPRNITARVVVVVLTAVPPLIVGLSLLPNGSVTGMSALLTMCALSVFGAVVLNGGLSGIAGNDARPESAVPEIPNHAEQAVDASTAAEPIEFDWDRERVEPASPAENSAKISQWMSRTLADDGAGETIEGVVMAEFAAGQKTAVVHLSFVPPLAAIPEIECEPPAAADVRLRTASVQTYGARIEARRGESIESEARIEIAYAAFAPACRDRAA